MPPPTFRYALFVQSEGERASRTWYLDIFCRDLWLTAFIFILCIACSIMGTYYVKKLICPNYTEFHDELSSPLFNLFYVLGGISGQGKRVEHTYACYRIHTYERERERKDVAIRQRYGSFDWSRIVETNNIWRQNIHSITLPRHRAMNFSLSFSLFFSRYRVIIRVSHKATCYVIKA